MTSNEGDDIECTLWTDVCLGVRPLQYTDWTAIVPYRHCDIASLCLQVWFFALIRSSLTLDRD